MAPPARSAQQRKQDTLDRLENDEDAWVASAGPGADVYLVPLSFLWDGQTITVATPESSPTARNLAATGKVRLSVGHTRDVVIVEGTVEAFTLETVPAGLADAFAAKRWDARLSKPRYAFFRITPKLIQAWRQVNELNGRDLMWDGRWLT
jgi:Pyridoxamine 5'-phosphate oxidase